MSRGDDSEATKMPPSRTRFNTQYDEYFTAQQSEAKKWSVETSPPPYDTVADWVWDMVRDGHERDKAQGGRGLKITSLDQWATALWMMQPRLEVRLPLITD